MGIVPYHGRMSESPPGLRSIKKQLTRESIAASALRLSLDKGLTHVTIDEIAHLAFVSPRTVSNYFSCKEEAVVAAGSMVAELVGRFEQAPGEGAPMAVLRQVITDFFASRTDEELEQTREWQRLIEGNVSLRAYQMADYDEAERHLQAIVAARTKTGDALYSLLVAAAGIAAVKVAVGTWARSDSPQRLADVLEAAFDHIVAGLKSPTDR
jgi:AcrR family transcriptional regulator